MALKDGLNGKKLVILGLARQGTALARFAARVGAEVVISDLRTKEQLGPQLAEMADLDIQMVIGEHPQDLLDRADVLAISGGVPADLPLVQEARRRGILVTNDSLEFMKRTKAKVVGITGSAGKTTTTALTGAMVAASGVRTWVGGNIGRPLIAELEDIHSGDVVIQELSSFQLELWTVSPPIAAILNITPNHLDRHKTMAAYSEAKTNILRYQSPEDVAILSADDAGAKAAIQEVRGRLRHFSMVGQVEDGAFVAGERIYLRDNRQDQLICAIEEIPLRGRHNILNILAAATLADTAGASIDAIHQAIVSFKSVEHRLELVRSINDVQFINDSIATAPERVIAALESFTEPIILLAGGRDKDMVWDRWADCVRRRVKAVILFGELAGQLDRHLASASERYPEQLPVKRELTLDDAVLTAASIARPGDIVLLAPGGTSFDAYQDFAERGQVFRLLVQQLPETM